MQGCATLTGGSKYTAIIEVPGQPNASIYRENEFIGKQNAIIKVKRNDANKLHFNVRMEGFRDSTYRFCQKKVRTVPITATIILTVFGGYIGIASGIAIEGATGGAYKPDANEYGISKLNFDSYKYTLQYYQRPIKKDLPKPMEEKIVVVTKSEEEIQQDKLTDLNRMLEEKVIDSLEYGEMKYVILGDSNFIGYSQKKILSDSSVIVENDSISKPVNHSPAKEENIEPELTPEQQEKLNDLNKMLEFGIITESEYEEMKVRLIKKDDE